jgi:hypothetical protein
MFMIEVFELIKFFILILFKVDTILNEIYPCRVYGMSKWASQVGYEIAFLAIITRIIGVELFIAKLTQYIVVLLNNFTK